MACGIINTWTFIGLLGAFLDLFIAYILLCGSVVAYMTSKILGFFGLSLPCPCNGLFGYRYKRLCVQDMLVNDPSQRISSIQSSAMKRFPFESIWNGLYRRGGGGGEEDGNCCQSNFDVETGGEASSSSWYEKNIFGVENGSSGWIPKGDWSYNQKPRAGLRRSKRTASDCGGKSLVLNEHVVDFGSSAGVGCKLGTQASITSVNSEGDDDLLVKLCFFYGRESLKEIGLLKQGSSGFEIDDDPFAVAKKELAKFESFCGGDKNAIRVLEQALDEEHASRTALYFELEKERTAAYTAADEAMAMILRLQEEKAAIEMEAKQYLRIIEEKTAFDAEEMNILKEILLRREREKLFLEKEVEAYKQMFFEKDQLDTDVYGVAAAQEQMTSNEDLLLMLDQIPQSVGDKCEITSIVSSNQSLDFGKELPSPGLNEDTDIDRNVFDVHVVNEDSGNKKDNKSMTSNSPKTYDYPTSGSETEPGRKRNSSDRSSGLPPIAPSRLKSSPSISRRNSMSAFDYEKYKIDNEVGLLRERLRIIQHGREKLNIPAGHKEREQSQMQMMENIAGQLQEIQHLPVPGKALRQASLPLPSSKVLYFSPHCPNLCRTLFCMITSSCSMHF
ncbi:hypothetical protein V6N12_017699 [Hibiscus sabdariffa]|uniref:GTD-binding domain-containing protein n=1 Tax=Hibiscus sabdariffa TaxID=183260 RepID=A0ABR2CGA3_9ROSI